MPTLVNTVPRYRKHLASGQAVVTLSGQDFYLGPHGTKVSRDEYDRRIAEWLARGRRPFQPNSDNRIVVVDLIGAYKQHAEGYYRKNGSITNEVTAIASASKVLREMYGTELADEFGPLKLQAVRQAMIRLDWSRKHINKQISRIVRMFAWATSQELIGGNVAQALREVKGLHLGRSEAKDQFLRNMQTIASCRRVSLRCPLRGHQRYKIEGGAKEMKACNPS